jgi:preprotein translocase subunit SecE
VARSNRKRVRERPRRRQDEVVHGQSPSQEAPGDVESAGPDTELAQARLAARGEALGNGERTRGGMLPDGEPAVGNAGFDREGTLAIGPGAARRSVLDVESGAEAKVELGRGRQRTGSVELPSRPRPRREAREARESLALRAVAFLQGSWRELERVQWPNRQQVMQATWVVIGFVAVAAAFLGISNLISEKIIHLILNQ